MQARQVMTLEGHAARQHFEVHAVPTDAHCASEQGLR
jgi:hypothetical protein